MRKKVEKTINCHEDIVIDGIHLPNCGFPINFRGSEEDSVPLSEIQLTIVLLFTAVCQCINEKPTRKSFVSLNSKLQKLILKIFKTIDPDKIFIQ